MAKFEDLIGRRYGELTVIKHIGINKYCTHQWLCKCDCGNICKATTSALNYGKKNCADRIHFFKPNKVEFDDNCAYIYVSGRTEPAIIDKEDYDKVKNYHWNNEKYSKYTFAKKQKNNKIQIIRIHRLIIGLEDENMQVDHINGNTLDNRKCNLRIVTQRQNSYNHKVRKNNKYGVTGIHLIKSNNTWNARIVKNGKEISLGCYKNFDDAVKARKEAEIKYFGEYRR